MENPASTNTPPPAHPGFSFAFQPIVNAAEKRIVSYEALVRGVNNESAFQVFHELKGEDLYRFDEACRVRAIELAEFQPDIIKIDIQLIRGIEGNGAKQAIIRGIARTCLDLGIDIMAEGVETLAEYDWFREEGIDLFQGYLFGKPAFHQLPSAVFPA